MTVGPRRRSTSVAAQLGKYSVFLIAALLLCTTARAQPSQAIDISAIGPKVGDQVPEFSGVDQFGKRQTLQTSMGRTGAMLVFFRSADW